jgi:hypothetical protein
MSIERQRVDFGISRDDGERSKDEEKEQRVEALKV